MYLAVSRERLLNRQIEELSDGINAVVGFNGEQDGWHYKIHKNRLTDDERELISKKGLEIYASY